MVQAKNYGGPLGQVRGNVFINAPGVAKWQLREWIVVNSGQPTPASFVPVTVKDNPLAQFYLDANGAGPDAPEDPVKEASERTEFQNQLLNISLARLLDPDVVRNFLTPGQPGYRPELDPKSTSFQSRNTRSKCLPESVPASKIASTNFRAFLKAPRTTRRLRPVQHSGTRSPRPSAHS